MSILNKLLDSSNKQEFYLKQHLIQQNPLYQRNWLDDEIKQRSLMLQWLDMKEKGKILHDPYLFGFQSFSQTNEDGILLYIFTIIGTTNKKVVEVGVNCDNSMTTIPEGNAINLIVHHGWTGLLCDANSDNTAAILHFFHLSKHNKYHFFNMQKQPTNEPSAIFSPYIRQAYITPDNINTILEETHHTGEIDLLMIDIDSYDYYVWDAIENCDPRVIVIETDGGKIHYETSVTVKRDASMIDIGKFMRAGFSGTISLAAACKFAEKKGYRLVYLSEGGWNAFFIRNDICPDLLPRVSIEEAYKLIPPIYALKERGDIFTEADLDKAFPNLFVHV